MQEAGSHPIMVFAIAVVVALGLAMGAWVFATYRRYLRSFLNGNWMEEAIAFELASDKEVEENLLNEATRQGKRDQALLQLSTIRRLYGHDGVRTGHIIWVLKVLAGEISAERVPPSFRP